MNCPKCGAMMDKVQYQSIEVDRCTNCEGLWFDMLEAEQLKELAGSERIDVGDPRKGVEFDQIGAIDCPVCRTRMVRLVDARQPHIWYEGCTICYGLFFDAGEFRDYKQETVLDFFQDLFAKKRDYLAP